MGAAIFSTARERALRPPTSAGKIINPMYNRGVGPLEKAELYLLKGVLFVVFVYELYQFLKFVLKH